MMSTRSGRGAPARSGDDDALVKVVDRSIGRFVSARTKRRLMFVPVIES